MSDEPSRHDRDLLSRLNALKRSTVDLDQKQFKFAAPQAVSSNSELPSSVGRDLHEDIIARFRALQGGNGSFNSSSVNTKPGTSLDIPELQNENNDKTVEELLSELGPEEEWALDKTEEEQVRDLLKEAQDALKDTPPRDKQDAGPDTETDRAYKIEHQPNKDPNGMPDIDVSVFQPEPDSDPEDDTEKTRQTKPELNYSLDREADEYLERIMDEIRQDKSTEDNDDDENNEQDPPPEYRETDSTADLPSSPPHDPSQPQPPTKTSSSELTDHLTARFSSLTLSNSNSLFLPSVPTTALKPHPKSNNNPSPTVSTTTYTDTDIETWCIICNDDATLQCLGCDGDLYCRNCWMEGHRGEGAGYEERRHRAMEYVKGKKKGKMGTKKVAMGV